MYLARFDLGGATVSVAALEAPGAIATLLPPPWPHRLLSARSCSFAVRLAASSSGLAITILLNSTDAGELEQQVRDLLGTVPQAEGARVAENEAEFDRLANPPAYQLWLNHRGYAVRGQALATDFRLFPQIQLIARRTQGFVYQCCFRAHHPERELERQIRKFLAALRLDSPFPPSVTELQSTLAARLLKDGFVTDELLGFSTPASLSVAATAIEESFQGTMGHFGFQESPSEQGDFHELFVTGLHSSWLTPDAPFITRAASTLSTEEARQFLQLRPDHEDRVAAVSPAGAGPPVFLSYSSSDFTQAWATCQFLEPHGVRCWIAPRNILPGESYPEAIVRGLSAARALVVLVSGASNLSPHVHREIERALNNRAVIIPMRVQPITPTGAMEYLLSTCHWLDAFAAFEQSLEELLARLRTLVGGGG